MSFYTRIVEEAERDNVSEYERTQQVLRASAKELIRTLRKRGYLVTKKKFLRGKKKCATKTFST